MVYLEENGNRDYFLGEKKLRKKGFECSDTEQIIVIFFIKI